MISLPLSVTIILGISTLSASLLYLREYFLRKKDAKAVQKISMETRQKTAQLLNAAQSLETEVIAQGNYTTKKLISEFKTQLQNLINSSEKTLLVSQDSLIQFMKDLQKRSLEFEESSNAATEKRINETFGHLETRLTDFLMQTEQKTTASIELELKATREMIETYRQGQLKLIDENIIAMLEKTLSIVLAKKLSLKDQIDLVYESLEKAKSEKFING